MINDYGTSKLLKHYPRNAISFESSKRCFDSLLELILISVERNSDVNLPKINSHSIKIIKLYTKAVQS